MEMFLESTLWPQSAHPDINAWFFGIASRIVPQYSLVLGHKWIEQHDINVMMVHVFVLSSNIGVGGLGIWGFGLLCDRVSIPDLPTYSLFPACDVG